MRELLKRFTRKLLLAAMLFLCIFTFISGLFIAIVSAGNHEFMEDRTYVAVVEESVPEPEEATPKPSASAKPNKNHVGSVTPRPLSTWPPDKKK